ncbi:DUF3413 domain-containing protein [Oceanimonas pelagia]|uniref:DUF3413 domain-containing protein n=1 Tax=Oceanimonas pelagia TaxID=3028314 RepID=A0AA50KM89_9GAMM|nr:DUF3413 domain-containing protein [Oceanimonas pelagia]WMC09666.1 DUF3413 domain-containing protein [Oceanimonas pelagia]
MVETGPHYRDNVSRLIGWGHWFVFFNILLAMAVSVRYLFAAGLPDSALGMGYMLVSWVGHFAFLTFCTYLLTLFPLTFVFPRLRAVQFLGAGIATAALTLLLVDTQVFSLFGFHLNPAVWRLLLDQAQAEGAPGWGWLFAWVPVLFVLELWLGAWLWRWSRGRSRSLSRPLTLPLLVCFFLTHSVHIWADATLYTPITLQKANFPLSYPMTAKGFLIRQGWLDEESYRQRSEQVADNPQQRLSYPLRPLSVQPPEQAPNILLVVADGLRADQLDAITMPNLSRFAAQHLRFDNHLSAGNRPEPALFSLFYSLPAHYRREAELERVAPVLINELQRQDYRIGLFASGGTDADLYRNAIFSTLRSPAMEPAPGGAEGDRRVLGRFAGWLSQQPDDRPWFSYVYLDALNALSLPEGMTGPFQPSLTQLNPADSYRAEQHEALLNRYRNAVFYTDQLLGGLLGLVQGLERNTLVVVTSGHGMEFNDNGNNTWGFGNAYSPAQLRVPLVIAWPGRDAPARFSHPTSHLDLAPTLLQQALGVTNPLRSYASGQSLFAVRPNRWRLASDEEEYAIYQNGDITLFNRRGDLQLLNATDYGEREGSNPELTLLMQVMNELNRFQGK